MSKKVKVTGLGNLKTGLKKISKSQGEVLSSLSINCPNCGAEMSAADGATCPKCGLVLHHE